MNNIQPDDICSVAEFAARYPHLGSVSAHRWYLFTRRSELEQAGAIARRGSRVFLVVPRYLAVMLPAGEIRHAS